MDLSNKVALVTGGTHGIGAATAIALAQAGAHVSLVARHDDESAAKVRAQITALGRRCGMIVADCAVPAQAQRAVEAALEEHGALDVLVHSAGGAVNGGLFEVTPEAWMAAFDIHVHAVYHLCRAAIPRMKQRGEGAIVLISSTAGIRAIYTNVAYQTVKGALPQLTRALAREFAADNIRVNCVAPGVIRTRFHQQMSEETRRHNLDQRIPLKREGTSEQVASLIAQLITNDYITGETVVIDGGLTMRIA